MFKKKLWNLLNIFHTIISLNSLVSATDHPEEKNGIPVHSHNSEAMGEGEDMQSDYSNIAVVRAVRFYDATLYRRIAYHPIEKKELLDE